LIIFVFIFTLKKPRVARREALSYFLILSSFRPGPYGSKREKILTIFNNFVKEINWQPNNYQIFRILSLNVPFDLSI